MQSAMTLGRSDVGTEELDVVVLEGVDVVVVAPVKEVVVDEGRVVVGEFRLAWPEPPPHAARVATTARARTVPIDFIGHGRRLIGTVCAARVTTLQSVGALRGIPDVPVGGSSRSASTCRSITRPEPVIRDRAFGGRDRTIRPYPAAGEGSQTMSVLFTSPGRTDAVVVVHPRIPTTSKA